MTRERIAELLLEVVLRMANELPYKQTPGAPLDEAAGAEWQYVKGLASHPILTLRDRILELPTGATLREVLDQTGESGHG